MEITHNMDLGQLAERMGTTAAQTEAEAMRDLLVEAGHEGRDTSEVAEGIWSQMLARAVEIARAQDDGSRTMISMIELIKEEIGEYDWARIKDALEDGAALATLGVGDKDQEAVEAAHEYACKQLAEELPAYTLNDNGLKLLADWVRNAAKRPGDHNMDAWATEAEDAANNAGPDESIIIEMRGFMSASGRPETLTLPRTAFYSSK